MASGGAAGKGLMPRRQVVKPCEENHHNTVDLTLPLQPLLASLHDLCAKYCAKFLAPP